VGVWSRWGERDWGGGGEELSAGYKNSKTPERYTYISNKNIDKIKSPLV